MQTAKSLTSRLAGAGMALFCLAASAAEPERVAFDSFDEVDGAAVAIEGYLYKAAGLPDQAAAPAVVLFHGCGGLLTQSGKLLKRYRELAELVSGMGYTVLMPDSFNPRGEREICTTRPGEREIRARHRWLDAYGALRYLNARADVVPGKIAALGFSHGGTVALQAVDDTLSVRRRTDLGFAAAAAFYPGCKAVLNQKRAFTAYAPLLMMVGALDDWTPPQPCQELAERSRAGGQPVDIVTYADAYHGFDRSTPVMLRTDVTHGVNGKAGVHVGGNDAAREDAQRRLAEFFALHLGAPPVR